MPDLDFKVGKARAVPYSVSPLLHFSLRVTDKEAGEAEARGIEPRLIHTVALNCQIRIEPAQRRYEPAEQERLLDLFGPPARWGHTLRPMLWTHASLMIPSFCGATDVELPVPCTYDFNLAAAKFFYALEAGEAPLCLLFSGTVFHAGADDALQVAPISWEKEAKFRLPVAVWKEMMELYYPGSACLHLRRDAFDALALFKSRRGLPTWEAAIEALLAGESASSAARGNAP